ncbi:carbamoyltransferase family protein [Lacrimispora celerecrescens]|uniref:Carbamoyltransferase n=1 Tax=[Clostridium] celerecrescens 18A TaxID=1286362 RepID=A0A2M8ZCE5_9FIRM|nr:carbamoyltransferase [Lacrimispora celerecrescens]PJJ31131.1 carbamoyltransferase [[Clostridium] celerecrescens 18A]
MNILGISALYHDSAAALCCEGEILAAVQEERFTRKKADSSIPINAIQYCLAQMKGELDAVIYYDNPLLTLDRWLQNCIAVSPDSDKIIQKSFESIYGQKIWIHELLKEAIGDLGKKGNLLVCEHHMSHAASAFYPSPFEDAAILTLDGVGEWATSTIGLGKGKEITILEQMNYPNSLGLLYSAITYFCGFKVNSGEYKLMGLAPYGNPIYYNKIMENLISMNEDGSFQLNTEYFSFMKDVVMTGEAFEELFEIKRRQPESIITKEYMDIAASIQKVTEEIILKMARYAKKLTSSKNLTLAGGTALNCVANGKLLKEKIFENIWVQPAAGDAGGALGAALVGTYQYFGLDRKVDKIDSQKGSYLGPDYKNDEIKKYLDKNTICYHYMDSKKLFDYTAKALVDDKVIGIFNGKMEFGPRALGARSIIANPMSEKMQSKLNLKIKFRESFRPFAPAVLEEKVQEYFEIDVASPYMLFTAPVVNKLRKRKKNNLETELINYDNNMLGIINQIRSTIPAVTHVDYSARIQTVSKKTNPFFHQIITEFQKLTGCGMVVNTSFNVRGEPIVCTPHDAFKCFMRTDMDILVLENFVLIKEEQPEFEEKEDWRSMYELD